MPDAGALVRGIDIPVHKTEGILQAPLLVFDDRVVRVTAVAVTHGHAVPALAYRFDTAGGSVVFSGDTTVNDDLIALARGADILVHHVADLGYLGGTASPAPPWNGWPRCTPTSPTSGASPNAQQPASS